MGAMAAMVAEIAAGAIVESGKGRKLADIALDSQGERRVEGDEVGGGGQHEPDEAKRIELYKELQRKVMAEGPYIGMVQRTAQIAMRSNVKGYVVGPAIVYYRLVRKT